MLAIKQTLYRAGHESPVVDALVAAANAGKDVTVIVELRARFDEEANIELSNRLQEAGAHVMYGVVGYKTHAKMALVVRREPGGIRRYCHLGTGNYHPRTARAYTDYGLFTCNDEIGQDVHELFLQLTSLTQTPKLNRLVQSPFGMHDADAREDRARGASTRAPARPARIIAKMNALVDPQAIEALYRASRAGVQDRPDRARRVRAAPGRAGRVGEHPRALDRRALPRALARVLFRERRRAGDVLRQRRLDGAQLLPPRRGGLPDPREKRTASASCAISISACATTAQAWQLRPDGSYHRIERRPDETRRQRAGASCSADLRGGPGQPLLHRASRARSTSAG